MLKYKIYVCRDQRNLQNCDHNPLSYINSALKFPYFPLFTLISRNLDIAVKLSVLASGQMYLLKFFFKLIAPNSTQSEKLRVQVEKSSS